MAVRVLRLCVVVFTIIIVRLAAAASATTKDAVAQSGGTTTTTTDFQLPFRIIDPQDVWMARGQSVTLTCRVEPIQIVTKFEYKWYFNGEEILLEDANEDEAIEDADDDGEKENKNGKRWQLRENGSLLYIPKASNLRKYEGYYRCFVRIKDTKNGLLSNPAKLSVATLSHTFLRQPHNVSLLEKRPAVIPCYIESTPKAVIRWKKDNLPLPQDKRYVPLSSGALLITSVSTTDVGNYRCIAENAYLKKFRSSDVGFVNVTKLITRNEKSDDKLKFLNVDESTRNYTVPIGGNFTLYCIVNGWPQPTIQWLNDLNVVVGNKSTLEFRNAKPNKSGIYTCTALNSRGHISQSYHVEVQEKPKFHWTPVSRRYPNSQTIRLNCTATGHPAPAIVWYKNGRPLLPDARIKKYPYGIVFSHSFVTDEGFYQCVASNSAGTISTAAYLLCSNSTNIPEAPSRVECAPYDDHNICIRWTGSRTVSAFTVYSFETAADWLQSETVTKFQHVMIKNLKPNTNYTFYVRAFMSSASERSEQVTCVTGVTGDRNLQLRKIANNSLLATWTKISSDTACGNDSAVATYKLYWKRSNKITSFLTIVDGFAQTLTGFEPGATYYFKITTKQQDRADAVDWKSFVYPAASEDVNRTLTYSSIHKTWTNTTKPTVPYQLDVINVTATAIHLKWKDDENDPGEKYFDVCYCEAKEDFADDCSENGRIVNTNSTNVQIRNLRTNTEYQFKVRAYNKHGVGDYSNAVEVRTLADVPIKVERLRYFRYNETTACVTWGPPIFKSGSVVYYVLSYTPDQNWPLETWFNLTAKRNSQSCSKNDHKSISVLLHGLDPRANYTLIVRAANSVGLGNPSMITLNANLPFHNVNNKNYFNNDRINDVINRPIGDEDGKQLSSAADELNQKQNLGVVIGLTILAIWFIGLLAIFVFRRYRRIKRESLRNQSNKNGLAGDGGNVFQLRNMNHHCVGDAHERQQLVVNNGKAGVESNEWKNGRNPLLKQQQQQQPINGVKPFLLTNNGHVPSNGNYRITENPQFYYPIANGHASILNGHAAIEDTNSNIASSEFNDANNLYMEMKNNNTGRRLSPVCHFPEDCTRKRSDSIAEYKRVENQIQSLDDSSATGTLLKVPSINEIISPILSPNG